MQREGGRGSWSELEGERRREREREREREGERGREEKSGLRFNPA